MALMAMMAGASLGASPTAGGTGEARVHRVTVCMDRSRNAQIRFATAGASSLFAGINVEIDWFFGGSCPPAPGVIRIAFSFATPETLHEGALAYARPYEGSEIVVFYDRISSQSGNQQVPVNCLLSYVLAHEIAHLLQGVSRHSPAGIMKARWKRTDTLPMRRKTLRFDPLDVELIDLGLRRARLEDGNPSSDGMFLR